jgi:EAL and modified HD-GYP domain-containing signal transduction protein
MSDIYIGRQPIFNVDLNVYAYQLLFRNSEAEVTVNIVDDDIATSQVMLNTFVDIGLENLVGRHKAFLNLTQYFLENPDRVAIPPGQVVLAVPGEVEPDDNVIETLRELKKRGHVIAVDDFIITPHFQPMISLADIIKIDVMALSQTEIEQHIARLKTQNIRLLAEKIETYEDFEFLKQLGFDYYQGYFFSKPTVVKGKGLKPNRASILNLVAKINNDNVDVQELSDIISTDVSLSHKILKFINSPASGLAAQIDSIQRAVVLLGLNTIKNWISIVALATGSDKPHELSTLALVRARTCEQLARTGGLDRPESFFTAGLFSTLGAMMDQPMSTLLEELPLPDELKLALLENSGIYGEAISCAIAMERNDPDNILFMDLDVSIMSELYLDALLWASEQSGAISA